jgi:hypothetical protein
MTKLYRVKDGFKVVLAGEKIQHNTLYQTVGIQIQFIALVKFKTTTHQKQFLLLQRQN